MNSEAVLKLLRDTDAMLEGHFVLSSGLHSNRYFQCAKVLQFPEHAKGLGKALAEKFATENITCVVGPAMGGIIIAHETASSLGVRCLFTERVQGKMALRRGFAVEAEDRVLVVEDVITTGGSAQEVIELLSPQCQVVGVGSIVDRSQQDPGFPVAFRAVVRVDVQTFTAESDTAIGLLAKGLPGIKPGSRT